MTTARDIALDAAGDIDVSTGDLIMLADAAAIVQAVRIHFSFFKGEWFLDLDAGVPYYQSVFGKVKDPAVLAPIFRAELVKVKGISLVNSLTLKIDTAARTLSIVWSANGDPALLNIVTPVGT